MRAIRVEQFGGPEVLQVADVDDPVPGPGEVVVRLHAAGVNPVEAYIRSGQYARGCRCCRTRLVATARAWSMRSAKA